jgi:hypothetical protein
MDFKEWLKLQEVGTSTGSVAGFSRMTIPMVRRQFMPHWGEGDPFFTSKKKKKKEVLKEVDTSMFDPKEVKMGMKVEKEHDGGEGKDVDVVKNKTDLIKIVVAHLREDPKYYTKLNKVGL